MASCYRPDSPIFSQGRNRVRDICLSEGKIHRIVPKLEAVCRLAHIDSPQCIWFKMADHICPKLQLAVPSSALRPLENPPAKYDYVMAPLEEGIYARARVLFVQQLSGDRDLLAFVHFIDEGVGAWLLASCLTQMGSQLYCYPWQAFPVALFKIELDNEEYSLMFREENWLEQVKGQLLTIMSQFELFKVVPVPNKTRNNYCEYSRAEIYGLKAPEDNKPEAVVATEESIGHQLAMDMPFELLNRNMFDVQHQPLPAIEDMQPLSTEEEVLAMLKEMPKWRQHFPSNLNHSNLASSKDNNILDQLKRENSLWEWDEELGPVWVRTVTAEWLKVKCSLDGNSILLHLDIYSLKSPFEFYGFPLRTVQGGGGGSDDHVDSIKRLYDQQAKLSETLTTFYGNPENSKPIEVDKVAQQLTSQAPFYAIYHQIGDEAQGPAFRRVQLLSLRNMEAQNWKAEFGRIRYLDFGGTELVPISSLIRIHSSHCKQRPLCIQLCLDGICPSSSASTWNLDELKCFRSLFPVNLPAQSELRLIVPDNAVVNFDTPAHRWPGVFGAYNLCIDGQKMEETMVAKGKADWALSNGVVNGTTQQIAGLQMQITDN